MGYKIIHISVTMARLCGNADLMIAALTAPEDSFPGIHNGSFDNIWGVVIAATGAK